MPVKIVRGNHREIIGRGAVLLMCPPSSLKNQELYTGSIVEETALLSKSHALIEGETKQPQDMQTSQDDIRDFQSSTKELVDEFQIKLILLMVGSEEPGIDILLGHNGVDIDRIIPLLKQLLEEFDLRIVETGTLSETGMKEVQSIQLGLGPDERGFKRDQVISSIVDLVGQINVLLGPSEGDERASNVLD